MSDYIRSKSFSHSRFNLTTNFYLPEKSQYFLFKIRDNQLSQENIFQKKIRIHNEKSFIDKKQLKNFKTKVLEKLNKSMNEENRLENIPNFAMIGLN